MVAAKAYFNIRQAAQLADIQLREPAKVPPSLTKLHLEKREGTSPSWFSLASKMSPASHSFQIASFCQITVRTFDSCINTSVLSWWHQDLIRSAYAALQASEEIPAGDNPKRLMVGSFALTFFCKDNQEPFSLDFNRILKARCLERARSIIFTAHSGGRDVRYRLELESLPAFLSFARLLIKTYADPKQQVSSKSRYWWILAGRTSTASNVPPICLPWYQSQR